MMNDELDRLLKLHACLTNGIAPLWSTADSFYSKVNIKKALASLPADEARKMKRKFRKMWRKLAKQNVRAGATNGHPAEAIVHVKAALEELGAGKRAVGLHNAVKRRRLVMTHLLKNVVDPARREAEQALKKR